MSRLIEDMLFLANSDANAWRLSMEDTALDTLLLDVFEKYEPEAAKKSTRFPSPFQKKKFLSVAVTDKESRRYSVFSWIMPFPTLRQAAVSPFLSLSWSIILS